MITTKKPCNRAGLASDLRDVGRSGIKAFTKGLDSDLKL